MLKTTIRKTGKILKRRGRRPKKILDNVNDQMTILIMNSGQKESAVILHFKS